MSSDLRDSIVLITGSDPKNFGTGFVIHQDEEGTYLLTCAHVVNQVGGPTGIKANNIIATVIASDTEDGFDLAVLRIDGLLKIPPLGLTISRKMDCSFITAGYYLYNKLTLSQEVELILHKSDKLRSSGLGSSIMAWHLKTNGKNCLQCGHSGAPLVNKENGKVLGVISHRESQGQQGLAISIEALPKIWLDMPKSLLVRFKTPKMNPPSVIIKSRPLMNFENELAAFREIVTGQDIKTRLILVHGPSGIGKSRLLEEYKDVANKNDIEILRIPLGPQITVEECLDHIIYHLNINHFPCYTQFRKAGRPEPFTLPKEKEWQRNFTWEFFKDLSKCQHSVPLPIFFDQYEKAATTFKEWLGHVFLPGIFSHPFIVVVVAGQEEIEQKPVWQGCRHFPLTGVTVDWYHRYAADCNVHIEPEKIDLFHMILKGEPKRFVDHINSLIPIEAGGGTP